MENLTHRRLLTTVESSAASTPEMANSTAEAELSQANFDTNMVIILAALLCAMVCALGLNSVVRCVLRCSRRGPTVRVGGSAGGGGGLKRSVLDKVPIHVYGADHHGGGGSGGGGGGEEECPICLGEFVDGDKVRVLPKCNHMFHVKCVDTWLGLHSSCPNCRHSVVVDNGGGGRGRGGGENHVVVEVRGETMIQN
ncbi:hypothetical protein RND81_05G019100 [Saponaria officinalis]|uniref:RING-type E3 ubiquitin transferase n=1 Tax=Saponaria officinalis TaxID=3572 RepID=A0AAW1KWH7_SAPOF